MSASGRLGIVDWGIGGLDLYRRLRATGSPRDVLYWSDAGEPPYGTLSADALGRRLGVVLDRMRERGCDDVVVACNAASTALGHPEVTRIVEAGSLRVVGVIEPTLQAIDRQGLAAVDVIGGRRTIESEAYAAPLRARGIRVRARVAQPLSALIERGLTEGDELEACVARILEPLADAEHLVLACTHYVAARPAIERRLPRLRSVIDPAAQTLRWMDDHWGPGSGRGEAHFVTTGRAEAMRAAAERAFGVMLDEIDELRTPDAAS